MKSQKCIQVLGLCLLMLMVGGCSTPHKLERLEPGVLQHLTNCRAALIMAQGLSNVRYTDNRLMFDPIGTPIISSATPITRDGFYLTTGHSVPTLNDTTNRIWILERSEDGVVREKASRLIHLWEEADLALVHAERDRSDHVQWASEAQLERGEPVWKSSARTGNTLGKILSTIPLTNGMMIINHSCKVRPGDSGSPLITPEGDLLGINVARIYFEWSENRLGFGGSQAVRPSWNQLQELMNLDRAARQEPASK